MYTLALIAALVAAPSPQAQGPVPVTPTFMPQPKAFDAREGVAILRLPWVTHLQPAQAGNQSIDDARVQMAIDALSARLLAQATKPAAPVAAQAAAAELHVAWAHPGQVPQALGEDETYVLDVTEARITLTAQTPLGVLRGLQTLSQMLEPAPQAGGFAAATGTVVDGPRFVWRGVLLDVARHFLPVADIERQLTAMAAVKFNVLHWHLSDDQGFRVESRVHPKLHGLGSDGEFYTQDQVRHVVAYAANLGIRVVPEFDMPGHTDSWLLGYPELAAGKVPDRIASTWGIFDSVLDPTRETTYQFIDGLIGEMASLFPDAYLHIGGDENTGKQWAESQDIQAFMSAHSLADGHALQGYFIGRVRDLARAHGRTIVGWDEILAGNLPADAVVQSWQGGHSLVAAIEGGHPAILSSGYYLSDNPAGEATAEAHYLNDPGAAFTGQDPPNLLGGEVCQWSELVPPHLLDVTLWPRAAAVAERLWSPGSVRDVLAMYRRLEVQASRLTALGIAPAGPQQRLIASLLPGRDTSPLLVLADALEARRANWWPKFRAKRPLHSFADALPPESPIAREMRPDVALVCDAQNDVIARAAAAERVDKALADVIANGNRVAHLVAASGTLADAAYLNQEATAIATLGREALAHLASAKAAPKAWLAQATQTLSQASHRDVGAVVAFAPEVSHLVALAAAPPRHAEPANP